MVRKYLSVIRWCGQTLIETVIALAVVIIMVSALLTMSVASVRSATLSKNKNAAAQLAYKESERIRNSRDVAYGFSNWTGFTGSFSANNCNSACHMVAVGDSWDFLSGAVTNGIFSVSTGGSISGNSLTYTVTVSWTDSLGNHAEKISSTLTNWK